ncbi:MAG TPA: NTP transferase domain-containing protein [Jatrophihabitans sp.]|nr:NTP transferase domain-containing protein [Jatrophihabitans sp.]
MDSPPGWRLDPELLRPVLTDRRRVEAALVAAGPLDRLVLLPLLGRVEQALVEAEELLPTQSDPWQLLLRTADLHRWQYRLDRAAELQAAAWRVARSRDRQASTLHRMGELHYQACELDRAAGCFELALTMRRGFADAEAIAETEQALAVVRRRLGYDAIVLAGGRGSRQGGVDKPGLPLAGWPLVDHVLLAASGASNRIVVGPYRRALAGPMFCREQPAGAGPVAAIAAGAELVRRPTVAVLAADLPFIGAALDVLRRCVTERGRQVGLLVDTTGRSNYLAAVWRTSALLQALDGLGDPAGLPMSALYTGRDIEHVPDFDALGADCDTPDDLADARNRIRLCTLGQQLPAALLAWPRLELHSPS